MVRHLVGCIHDWCEERFQVQTDVRTYEGGKVIGSNSLAAVILGDFIVRFHTWGLKRDRFIHVFIRTHITGVFNTSPSYKEGTWYIFSLRHADSHSLSPL